MNIDVTSMIDPYIAQAQTRAAREIDAQAESFDLRQLLAQAWALSAIPLDLDTAGDPPLRFGMHPVGLRVDALSGDATELRLRLAVVGRFWTASRIPFAVAGPLPPPLQSSAPAYVANLELPLDLLALQSELQAALQGATISHGDITVTAVELRVVTGGVAVGLQLSGASTANVWALGTLVHEEGGLRFAELHWSDETAAAMNAAAISAADHDEGQARATPRALLIVLSRWQHPVAEALGQLQRRALAGMQNLAQGFEGISAHATLELPASGGVVFGDTQAIVLRVPTPGQLIITVDAASVAGPL